MQSFIHTQSWYGQILSETFLKFISSLIILTDVQIKVPGLQRGRHMIDLNCVTVKLFSHWKKEGNLYNVSYSQIFMATTVLTFMLQKQCTIDLKEVRKA